MLELNPMLGLNPEAQSSEMSLAQSSAQTQDSLDHCWFMVEIVTA
jgi:hypothetical protein